MASSEEQYFSLIFEKLKEFQNPKKAIQQAKYLKNKFNCLGIPHPTIRKVVREYQQLHSDLTIEQMKQFNTRCFASEFREVHHACIFLNERMQKQMPGDYIEQYEWMIQHQSWWDSVDYLAKLCGIHFKKFPQLKLGYAEQWIQSENMWLNRVAIIFQLHYKQETNFELLKKNILLKANSNEFFIQKAAGWALRNYARIDPEAVKMFVNQHDLAKLTKREALKHC